LPGFGEGRWWVQDLAASLPARLMPAGAKDVLDLCAAPGGKTMQLAAAKHRVTAVDASKSRLGRLRENLDRTHLDAKLVEADALKWEARHQYDAILLDAPCSATGTFRRHPEVLYRARRDIIASSVELQLSLLHRAIEWLKPSGALIYAVCSLERAEGEDVVRKFLSEHEDVAVEPPGKGELPAFVPVADEGWVRILPGILEEQGGLDGFFMVRLVRRAG
jgi:16S rRNA (cytosine967-C5)-methyltransferase